MNICFVTPRFPYPVTKGDQLRAYHQIRCLSRRHAVTLVAASTGTVDAAARAEMERWCERIEIVPVGGYQLPLRVVKGMLLSNLPLQVSFYAAVNWRTRLAEVLLSKRYNVLHLSLLRAAPTAWNVALPTVIDLIDALERSISSRSARVPMPIRLAYDFERSRVARYEAQACARFSAAVVCAQADADALNAPNVSVVHSAVDIDYFAYAPEGHQANLVMMTGNLGYQPNIDAADWFVQEVWPHIRRAVPEARFRLVGARPAPAVTRLERFPGVEVVGQVGDMSAYLRTARVAVCPMRCGSGIQTKLLEAMASGTPVVSTPLGNEGVAAEAGVEILTATEPETFASTVVALLRDRERCVRLAQAGRALVEREFSWELHARRFEAVYADAVSAYSHVSSVADQLRTP